MDKPKGLVLFEEKQVRRVWDEKAEKWWFSIVDVVGVLTDQPTARSASNYWRKLKQRLIAEGNELVTNCHQLKLESSDGKQYFTDVADTEQLLRLIQSIPSPKAEPFKRWLAKVGYERIKEIEDPELAVKRTHDTYIAKGYSEEWTAQRMRGIAIRETLTEEWKNRGIEEGREYAILTAEISDATFGMTPSEYKKFKGLENRGDNLRDHMTDLELIFNSLGEAATTEIARTDNAQGFDENRDAAYRGGKISGDARKNLEAQTGHRVSTKNNYKMLSESEQRKLEELKADPKRRNEWLNALLDMEDEPSDDDDGAFCLIPSCRYRSRD